MKLIIILALFLFGSVVGLAKDNNEQKDLIQVTGTLNPEYSIELSQDDMKKLVATLKDLEQLKSYKVDINDLYYPEDADAIKRSAQLFSDMFISAAKDMIEMKVIIHRLAAILTVPSTESHHEALSRSYQSKLQEIYNRMISHFGFEQSSRDVLNACHSELCVASIGNAMIELSKFVEEFNQGFEVDDFDDLEVEWGFKNELLKASLSATAKALLQAPQNNDSKLYQAAVTPFVTMGRDETDVGPSMAKFLSGGKEIDIDIEVEELKKDFSYERMLIIQNIGHKIDSVSQKRAMGEVTVPPLPYHLIVLTCEAKASKSGNPAAFHIFFYGEMEAVCKSQRQDTISPLYNAKLRIVGPGLEVMGMGGFVILIQSPVEITPIGTWFGASVRVGALYSVTANILGGKYGSSAELLGGGVAAIGAVAGFSWLQIERQ